MLRMEGWAETNAMAQLEVLVAEPLTAIFFLRNSE